jgi:hypothetical protein
VNRVGITAQVGAEYVKLQTCSVLTNLKKNKHQADSKKKKILKKTEVLQNCG